MNLFTFASLYAHINGIETRNTSPTTFKDLKKLDYLGEFISICQDVKKRTVYVLQLNLIYLLLLERLKHIVILIGLINLIN